MTYFPKQTEQITFSRRHESLYYKVSKPYQSSSTQAIHEVLFFLTEYKQFVLNEKLLHPL